MADLQFRGKVFRLHLKESREGFCPRGRGRSLHVDGPKTLKAREPTNSLKSGGASLASYHARSLQAHSVTVIIIG